MSVEEILTHVEQRGLFVSYCELSIVSVDRPKLSLDLRVLLLLEKS